MLNDQLQHWLDSIEAYIRFIINTRIYTGSDGIPIEELFTAAGYDEVYDSWYDGLIIGAKREGIKMASAWCANTHSFEDNDFTFCVTILEIDKADKVVYPEYAAYDPAYTWHYVHDDKLLKLPDEYIPFQTALLDLCEKISTEFELFYIPRLMTIKGFSKLGLQNDISR